ncbi:MAG: ribonuclease HII [Cyanobacteria bacterium REEB67]|nr:ribonuclease HII [Cyanobacteria bacterium REEB67]
MAFDRQSFAGDQIAPAPAQIQLFASAHKYVIGVDEVGRGCLAGPVVAAAVILPAALYAAPRSALARKLAKLDDSKLIPQPLREELQAVIASCAHYSVAEASVAEIDDINILNASLLAMKRAVYALLATIAVDHHEVLVLVDGNRNIKDFVPRQKTVIQGDSKSASIAAASVMAKVYRDQLMRDLSSQFPHYLWQQNKGYGSKAHRSAILEHGITPWHRQSFRLMPDANETDDYLADDIDEQLELALKRS